MSKFPIEWHQQSLTNLKASLAYAERRMKQAIDDFERMKTDANDYEAQIEEAIRRGMDGFDSERFLKKRTKNA